MTQATDEKNPVSIFGALFVGLGIIGTCIRSCSNVQRPSLLPNQAPIKGNNIVDWAVITLHTLLALKKEYTMGFFREDGLKVLLKVVIARPQRAAALFALKIFQRLDRQYTGFRVMPL
jgi:hypothetical protein